MIILSKNSTSDIVIVTLEESRTLNNPYYLFVFKSTTPEFTVTKIVNSSDDASNFKNRFNSFTFNTSTIFATADAGQYQYYVYEQASSTNTDPTGLNLVECGKMFLKQTSADIFTGYQPTTTYKGYNG
jgi:hypothetical protein